MIKILILIIMLFWYLVLSIHNVILLHRINKAYKFIETEYNTYPSAEEWRNALKKILKGEENEN